MQKLVVTSASNDILTGDDGAKYIDLFSAFGATWLGHVNPEITRAIHDQLNRVWMIGAIDTPVRDSASKALNAFFPDTHNLAGFYSTGMEASEFAMRHARVTTGRNRFVGFDRNMHGKSMATAFLGWNNRDGVDLPQLERLPYLAEQSEHAVFQNVRSTLAARDVAALFVEPIQGSGGGYQASDEFYQQVAECCREVGTLLVFDEILTGFYRTGPRFFHEGAAVAPDTILLGKALGNGFPVSAVVTKTDHPVSPKMLPASTFSGNPLACAAVLETLNQFNRLDLESTVAGIHDVISNAVDGFAGGVAVRGRGAFWVIEVPETIDGRKLVDAIYRRGVAVGYGGGFIRLLPPATIEIQNLHTACRVIVEELNHALK